MIKVIKIPFKFTNNFVSIQCNFVVVSCMMIIQPCFFFIIFVCLFHFILFSFFLLDSHFNFRVVHYFFLVRIMFSDSKIIIFLWKKHTHTQELREVVFHWFSIGFGWGENIHTWTMIFDLISTKRITHRLREIGKMNMRRYCDVHSTGLAAS